MKGCVLALLLFACLGLCSAQKKNAQQILDDYVANPKQEQSGVWTGYRMNITKKGIQEEIHLLCTNPTCCNPPADVLNAALPYANAFNAWMLIRLHLFSTWIYPLPAEEKAINNVKALLMVQESGFNSAMLSFISTNGINPLLAWPLTRATCDNLNKLSEEIVSYRAKKAQSAFVSYALSMYENMNLSLIKYHEIHLTPHLILYNSTVVSQGRPAPNLWPNPAHPSAREPTPVPPTVPPKVPKIRNEL